MAPTMSVQIRSLFVNLAGCKMPGVCSPLKCDFCEFFPALQKVVAVVRELAARVAAVD
jgi:hypothetical protein